MSEHRPVFLKERRARRVGGLEYERNQRTNHDPAGESFAPALDQAVTNLLELSLTRFGGNKTGLQPCAFAGLHVILDDEGRIPDAGARFLAGRLSELRPELLRDIQ